MADEQSSVFEAGQTGLVIGVPEAEPAVRGWRERLDPAARAGVPAHVTVLYPFLDESRIDEGLCTALAEVFARHAEFDLRFARCGRFPGVLYLAPEPDGPLRRLTEAVVARWPEAPPYAGKFTEVVPHLTVVQGEEDEVLDEIEAAVGGRLPFTCRVSSVDLMVYDGVKWQQRASFALLPDTD
ncbi:2'-5' RNA ligase family protein [Streptomyces sp. NPDC048603]|uniref:2'-5' RNA ligase family protein n=1 Tax=Streptomyces sp. NPDC048603 TaxID=3365577 RepID=UPI00371066DB